MSELFKGLSILPYASVIIEGDIDFDLWRYQTYGERTYVANLCALPAERLNAWRGRFLVHADTICWQRAIRVSHSRYEDRFSSSYWNNLVKWERQTLSALRLFLPYHLLRCYNLTEAARDRLLVRIPDNFTLLDVFPGFKCKQEPICSYKLRAFIEDRESGLSVVAYTERVLRVCATLLMAVYAEYHLWYVPPYIIGLARNLGMDMSVALGPMSTASKFLN